MPRQPLTALQVELIERARHRGHAIYATAGDRTPPAPKAVADLDHAAIWAKWNNPPTPPRD